MLCVMFTACTGGPEVDATTLRAVASPQTVGPRRCGGDGVPIFVESAAELGVDFFAPLPAEPVAEYRDRHVGGGAAVIDVTGDDWPDLVFTAVHGAPALFVALGDGHFERRTDAGFESLPHTLSAYAVDLDDDGLRDVVLTSWEGVYPFHNLGDGHFEARDPIYLAQPDERPTFLSWTDYDGDGFVDAYLGIGPPCFQSGPHEQCHAEDRLLRGLGNFAFADESALLGTPEDRGGLALTGGWMDLDRDGDLDMLVGNDSGAFITPNRVFANPGSSVEAPFDECSNDLGLAVGMAAMGAAFGDVDGDGGRTLVVSHTRHLKVFESSPDSSTYVERELLPGFDPEALGDLYLAAGWGVELEDVDHDGDRDLLAAFSWLLPGWWWTRSRDEADLAVAAKPLPNQLWLREDGGFVNWSWSVDHSMVSWNWRNMLPVDIDRDGTLDLVVTSQMGPVSIQLGRCVTGGWLEVGLHQRGGNTDALGAMVSIDSPLGTQWRRIGHGSDGAHSGREPVAHFGLGDDRGAEVHVIWPDGESLDVGMVEANQRIVVDREPLP